MSIEWTTQEENEHQVSDSGELFIYENGLWYLYERQDWNDHPIGQFKTEAEAKETAEHYLNRVKFSIYG